MPSDHTRFTLIAVLGILLVMFLLIRMSMIRRLKKSKPLRGPLPDEERIKNDLQKILIEIQEVSHEQISTLDSKIRLLNALLVEADQKILTFKELLGRAEQALRTHPAPAPTPAKPQNPLHARVFESADKGMDVEGICRETGLEKGEVELILGLRHMTR